MMPTLGPGRNKVYRQRGFSLLEVLVVLAIIGIVTSTITLSVRAAGDARTLREDARRLAQLLPMAQAEARRSGRPVVWEYDEHGYRFSQAPRALMLPAALLRHAGPTATRGFSHPSPLRPREWSADRPVTVALHPSAANAFYDEWVSGPLVISLSDGLTELRLLRSGNGQYRVDP